MSTRTDLELTDPAELRPGRPPAEPFTVVRAEEPAPEFGRFLNTAVGSDWLWLDRLDWDHQRWLAHLSAPGVETWVGWLRGTPAGYGELVGTGTGQGTEVEVRCFGLLPAFIGRGLGGHLLTEVLRAGWSLPRRWPGFAPVHRVWLHTSTLERSHALANYRARGMRVAGTREIADDPVPAIRPEPWPGANRPRPVIS